MTKTAGLMAVLVCAYLGLNYPWSHVALASMTGEMRRCPPNVVANARARVAAFVGEVRAAPWILCQRQAVLGLDVAYGTARFAPLLPAFVVIGPLGMTADVMAHEWMHAEIAARTSALLRTYRMPTWFDEGLAMQLDDRADYSEQALRSYREAGLLSGKSLDQLAQRGVFFRRGDEGKAHYAFARCVVGRWLAASGRARAMKVLEEVSWSGTFPSQAFADHALACRDGSA